MKTLVLLCSLLAAVSSETGYCYSDVVGGCGTRATADLKNCTAKYGAANEVMTELQSYVNTHIDHSFQYLLMATHFDNFEKNREGFHKLFQTLSDSTWNDAIELMKYIGKRGGHMNFAEKKPSKLPQKSKETYELFELESLAKALDMQKHLAEEAFHIHGEVARRRELLHDPEVASYLENNFLHNHASSIRELAGHTRDLERLITDNKQPSLSLYLFDEYLQAK